MCSEGKEMGLLGEAKLFWEKEKVTRTLEKEGEGVGASCVCVYTSLHGTQSDIYMSVAASVQNMALLIVHISILVFTCSVCILSSLVPSPPPQLSLMCCLYCK